jgi:hypothetical protein
VNCTLNCETKATLRADAAFASTEKSAAGAEHAQNTTQATYSNQTQPATTYPKFYAKTLITLKNSKFVILAFSILTRYAATSMKIEKAERFD